MSHDIIQGMWLVAVKAWSHDMIQGMWLAAVKAWSRDMFQGMQLKFIRFTFMRWEFTQFVKAFFCTLSYSPGGKEEGRRGGEGKERRRRRGRKEDRGGLGGRKWKGKVAVTSKVLEPDWFLYRPGVGRRFWNLTCQTPLNTETQEIFEVK